MKRVLVMFVALLCAAALPARADESDDEPQPNQPDQTDAAKEHYQAGLQAYNAARYDVALAELRKAYQLKPLPLLLLNIGATYRKMGQPEMALQLYKKFLDVAPDDARERPEVTATVAELERQVEAGAPAPAGLAHTVIETAPPDAPVDVRVSTPIGARLFVFYRQSGVSEFTRVPMKARGAERVGRIPAAVLSGVAMEYYIEARDSDDRVIASSGSAARPNVVLVDPSAPSQTVGPAEPSGAEVDNETPPIIPASGKRAEAPPRRLGPVFWTGLVFSFVGAAGVALGISGELLAKQRADSITHDAQHSPSFQFNDPTAPGCPSNCMDDARFQKDGLMWNTVGLAGTIAGGVLLATGVTMMIVGAARHHGPKDMVGRSAFAF